MSNTSKPDRKALRWLFVIAAYILVLFTANALFPPPHSSPPSSTPSPTIRQTLAPTSKPTPTPAPSTSGKSGGGNTNIYDNPDQQNTDGYVLNTSTKKFHRPSCGYVPRIKSSNYATVKSRSSATLGGYDPCQKCNP